MCVRNAGNVGSARKSAFELRLEVREYQLLLTVLNAAKRPSTEKSIAPKELDPGI